MNLSARELRAVVALAEERNFTRAAQRCHLSQSAFSTLIRGVEDALGAKLFERSTRNVEPTPEGRMFDASARRVLGELDAMVSDFRDHAARRKGRVAIAALPSLAAGWLPGVFAEFRRRFPGIELELFDTLSDQCLALLRSQRVELAIAPAGRDEADLATDLLCADRFYVVCAPAHPLAALSRIRAKDLAAFPFIQLARSTSVRQHLQAALHPVALQSVLEVEHLATVAGMVEAGLGITVVPELTLFHFDRPRLAVRPLHLPGLVRNLYLVRRRGQPLSAAAHSMAELMRERKPRPSAPPRARPSS
ncbi:MAG TPA: LysR substrate-binding domain-containing protein [Burkholderiaceae bacterium]|nr:LysR substrate-binding domain-containing protein [Burkholderiaceae bacterium]